MVFQKAMSSTNCRGRRGRPKSRESFSWKKISLLSKVCKLVPKVEDLEEKCAEKSFEVLSTSDYSSCSCSSEFSKCSSDFSKCYSTIGVCSDHDCLSDIELDFSSDSNDETDEEIKRDTRRTRMLRHKNVTVIIPENNLSGYTRDEFYLEFIEDLDFIPSTNCHTSHVSEIVSVEPHGARFYADRPALIYLPVHQKIWPEDQIICLCSNTPREITPRWERIPIENFTFKNGQVIIKAHHFSLFTVVAQKPFPEVQQRVTHSGSTIRVDSVPGVEVNFPTDSLMHDITAVVRVLYDAEPMFSNIIRNDRQALASPIIMIGPHGCYFRSNCNPVTVTLPLPNYEEILRLSCKRARLTVWQSSTAEDEPLVWERLDVKIKVERDCYGAYTVTFPVNHFSFFKVLWDVLASSLYEAKLGVAYFYPYISFSMMCQAWMEENKDSKQFGLEVICYRSDKKLPEATNYRYKVGSSLKPKLVKPGCITVRLKSELFEADTDAGEDSSLIKHEPDFRGREFEKQFACKFRQEKPLVERGTFGKVIVERKIQEGLNEPLFEFNLHKSGVESEPIPPDSTDRWSVVAIKELASTLQITEDNNWKKFARHIGFTKNEIQSKLLYSADPFLSMVNMYQSRGGTPEEFVQALYEISRQIRLHSRSPNSSTGSPGRGEASSSRKWRLWNLTPRKWRDKDDSDDTNTSATSASSVKRSNPSGSSGGSAAKRRRRFSDVSETMSSSEESSGVDNEPKGDARKLIDTDMWRISSLMNTMNWRALGRTLGLEESVLLNIEHAYKATGFRECAYQMLLEWKGRRPHKCTFGNLHTALLKENMNSIAKQLGGLNLGEETV